MKDMDSLQGEVRKLCAVKNTLEFKRKRAESFTEDNSTSRKKVQDCKIFSSNHSIESTNNSVLSHESEAESVINDHELLESFDEEMGF